MLRNHLWGLRLMHDSEAAGIGQVKAHLLPCLPQTRIDGFPGHPRDAHDLIVIAAMEKAQDQHTGGLSGFFAPARIRDDPAEGVLDVDLVRALALAKPKLEGIEFGNRKRLVRITLKTSQVCEVSVLEVGVEQSLNIFRAPELRLGQNKADKCILDKIFGSRAVALGKVQGPSK